MHSRILILIFAMAAFPLYPQESAEALAAAIQGRMNETKTLSADFIQTKRLNVMKHDLIIRGEVALDKKGRMAWREFWWVNFRNSGMQGIKIPSGAEYPDGFFYIGRRVIFL